ncbi:hypothetical protein OEA41_000013 [Lepraria neglecta]|uniref:PiggyBac transposable element-derived protein domain-containing protein n=1 Tax=Lepraria neglecta TaxID=209136 RepID=A0AAE0DP34_9LECA|nr:hypothetical protein OEA41_000013 [Lepraria neglecta]
MQSHGNIVRYGPNQLLVNSNTGLHGMTRSMLDKSKHFDSESPPDIYDHSKKVKKAKAYRPIAQTMGRWTAFSAIDKYLYRRKRRVVHRWFSDDAIKTFTPRMLSLIRIFCTQLHKEEGATDHGWTKPRNMRDYCKPI